MNIKECMGREKSKKFLCEGSKKVNRKVQVKLQAEAAANPRHQEEDKKWHGLTCA